MASVSLGGWKEDRLYLQLLYRSRFSPAVGECRDATASLFLSLPLRRDQSCNSMLTHSIVTGSTDNGQELSGNSGSEFIQENVLGLFFLKKNDLAY